MCKWLEQVKASSRIVASSAKGDSWGTRLVMSAVGAGLSSQSKGVVVKSCEALVALAREGMGVESWRWLVGGGEIRGDGLQW